MECRADNSSVKKKTMIELQRRSDAPTKVQGILLNKTYTLLAACSFRLIHVVLSCTSYFSNCLELLFATFLWTSSFLEMQSSSCGFVVDRFSDEKRSWFSMFLSTFSFSIIVNTIMSSDVFLYVSVSHVQNTSASLFATTPTQRTLQVASHVSPAFAADITRGSQLLVL